MTVPANELIEKYGFCIIPSGTLLFSGYASVELLDYMFFSTNKYVANVFCEKVQVWRTISEIKLIFLIDKLDRNSWVQSALPAVMRHIQPPGDGREWRDLDIKQNPEVMKEVVRYLSVEHGISGWLTSLEDKVELEVCLFERRNIDRYIEFVEYSGRNDGKYHQDSLVDFSIHPSKDFYDATLDEFNSGLEVPMTSREHSLKYLNQFDNWVKLETAKGIDVEIAWHDLYNLRRKLML